MASESIYNKYLKEHLDQVNHYLALFNENKEADNIHQLRVNIKKIKALIRFFAQLEPNIDYKKIFQPIRKLFKQAGEIREMQLYLTKFESFQEKKGKQERNLNAKLANKIDQFLVRLPKWEKTLNGFLDTITKFNHTFDINFLSAYFNSIIFKSNKRLRKGMFHDARMEIKFILYLKPLFSENQQHDLKINFEFLDNLQEKIGIWHDLLVSQNLSKSKDHDKKIQRELDTLVKEIKAITKSFLQTVYISSHPA